MTFLVADVLLLYRAIKAIPLHSGANEVILLCPFSKSTGSSNPIKSPSVRDVKTKAITPPSKRPLDTLRSS